MERTRFVIRWCSLTGKLKGLSLDKHLNFPDGFSFKKGDNLFSNRWFQSFDSPPIRCRSPDAQKEKRHPSNMQPPMRLASRARTGKWKPSMIHTGMKCICFAAPALRAQTDVSTSFVTVFVSSPHLNFTSTRDSSSNDFFVFIVSLPVFFFSCFYVTS